MASSALLSMPHLAQGAVPRIRAPVLSPLARLAKKAWRWNRRCSAELLGAEGEGAAAVAASAGAGRKGYPGCGTALDFL